MSHSRINALILGGALLASLIIPSGAYAAGSDEYSFGRRTEVSLLGGVQQLQKNDTALPDRFTNIPIVASVAYQISPSLAAEGDFTWLIPAKQNVDVGSGISEDRKTPDILSYQAGARLRLPATTFSPYVAAGAGAVTFLSNTDSDRLPQVDKSVTAFAVNFGGGVSYGLTERVGLRADLRGIVAFPSDHADGLSDATGADQIWMSRGVVGLSYRF